jgi:hypothetical protein
MSKVLGKVYVFWIHQLCISFRCEMSGGYHVKDLSVHIY